jgi:uncharacterized protein
MKEPIDILKVVVGSHAHGLATPESDHDYRGVFVIPTVELLKIGGTMKTTHWIEGNDDDTSWEIGHFLFLATKCNPTILETFLAPQTYEYREYGDELRRLFPYIWNSKGVYDAFIGYSHSQQRKFIDNKDGRPNKFAAAYLRTLYNAWELLKTGTFTIRIADTPVGETVHKFKIGQYQRGEVYQTCWDWEQEVKRAYAENSDKETELEPVNEFLLKVRKDFWS